MTVVPAVYTASAHGPRVGHSLPLFTLRNSCERQVRLWDFKQRRPVVLVFIHSTRCADCLQLLRTLAARRDDLAEFRAAVLIVAPDATDRLQQLRVQLGLPFTLLSDADGAVAARYLRSDEAGTALIGLFVADRYGECGLAATAAHASDLPGTGAVLAELAHAEEGTCSCLVPAWPEAPQLS
jgi:peroxiredoxin